MTQGQEIPILVFFGFALQWMRGFRWFNDGATLGVALVAGFLASLLGSEEAQWRPVLLRAFELVPSVLGGTMVGHMTAQVSPLTPKFNSFDKPPAGEEAPK